MTSVVDTFHGISGQYLLKGTMVRWEVGRRWQRTERLMTVVAVARSDPNAFGAISAIERRQFVAEVADKRVIWNQGSAPSCAVHAGGGLDDSRHLTTLMFIAPRLRHTLSPSRVIPCAGED